MQTQLNKVNVSSDTKASKRQLEEVRAHLTKSKTSVEQLVAVRDHLVKASTSSDTKASKAELTK